MTNVISALAARRRERSTPGPAWKTVITYGVAASRSTSNPRLDNADSDVTWLQGQTRIVGGACKRGFDMVSALGAILILLPLFCLIALAIKLWDRGPIFYRHQRVGLNGTPFGCLKFRSMVVNADEVLSRHLASSGEAAREWQETHKLKDDPRITPLGASMRKTSIDELPQLFNILKGEMSFVGPRPIVTAEVPKYGACIDHYLRARPGLTGAWQVSGRNDVDYAIRVDLDCSYVEGWSFWRDVTIIVKTARVVVTARGCY